MRAVGGQTNKGNVHCQLFVGGVPGQFGCPAWLRAEDDAGAGGASGSRRRGSVRFATARREEQYHQDTKQCEGAVLWAH